MKINVLGTSYLMRRVNLGQDEFMDRMIQTPPRLSQKRTMAGSLYTGV